MAAPAALIVAEETFRVAAIPNPFREERWIGDLPVGLSIADVLRKIQPTRIQGGDVVVTLNARRVPRERWHLVRPKAGTFLTVRSLPGDPVSAIIAITGFVAQAGSIAAGAVGLGGVASFVGSGLAAGIVGGLGLTGVSALVVTGLTVGLTGLAFGAIGTFGLNLALKSLVGAQDSPSLPQFTGARSSPTLQGAGNLFAPWSPIPEVFGELTWAPRLFGLFTQVEGDRQITYAAFAISAEGPVLVDRVQINGADLADFRDVATEGLVEDLRIRRGGEPRTYRETLMGVPVLQPSLVGIPDIPIDLGPGFGGLQIPPGLIGPTRPRAYWRLGEAPGAATGANEVGVPEPLLRYAPTGAISAIGVGNPAPVTSAGHQLRTGDKITISGSDSTPSIDGTHSITVTGTDTFTVPVNVTGAGTTGSWVVATSPTLGAAGLLAADVDTCADFDGSDDGALAEGITFGSLPGAASFGWSLEALISPGAVPSTGSARIFAAFGDDAAAAPSGAGRSFAVGLGDGAGGPGGKIAYRYRIRPSAGAPVETRWGAFDFELPAAAETYHLLITGQGWGESALGNSRLDLYVNGIHRGSVENAGGAALLFPTEVHVGRVYDADAQGWAHHWLGRIDEVAFYHVALPPQSAQEHHAAAVDPDVSGGGPLLGFPFQVSELAPGTSWRWKNGFTHPYSRGRIPGRVHRIQFDLQILGLERIRDDGDEKEHGFSFDYDVKRVDLPDVEQSWIRQTHEFKARTRDVFFRSREVVVEEGEYEYRARKREWTLGNVAGVFGDAVLVAVRGILEQPPLTDGTIATLTLRVPTEELGGRLGTVTVRTRRLLPIYDPTDPEADPDGFTPARLTRNPGDTYIYVAAKSPSNPHAAGDASGIEPPPLVEWRDRAAADGRHFDFSMDFETSTFEFLELIARSARATPDYVDGLITIAEDAPQAGPVQLFNTENSRFRVGRKSFDDLPEALHVRFWNGQRHQWDQMTVYREGFSADGAGGTTVAKEFFALEIRGLTDPGLVARDAALFFRLAELRPEAWEIHSGLSHIVCRRGDRVAYQHPALLVGRGAGWVRAVIGTDPVTGVDLDRVVRFQPGLSYGCRWRQSDGDVTVTAAVVNPATSSEVEQRRLDFVAPVPAADAPAEGNLLAFGEAGIETVPALALAIKNHGDLTATLTLVPYDDAQFAEGPIPPFQTGLASPEPDPVFLLPTPLRIGQVVSDETAMLRRAGQLVRRICVGFRPARVPLQGTGAPGLFVRARFRRVVRTRAADELGVPIVAYRSDDRWAFSDYVPMSTARVYLEPVVEGDLYEIQLIAVSEGGRATRWGPRHLHEVQGARANPPPDIADLTLEDDVLRWTPGLPRPIDSAGFRVRWHRGHTAGRRFRRARDAHEGLLQSTELQLSSAAAQVPRRVAITLMVTEVDVAGNESARPASITRQLARPLAENVVVVERKLEATQYPGTISGGYYDGRNALGQILAEPERETEQIHAFDDLTDLTGIDGTLAVESGEKQEGAASVRLTKTSTSSSSATIELSPAAPIDFTAGEGDRAILRLFLDAATLAVLDLAIAIEIELSDAGGSNTSTWRWTKLFLRQGWCWLEFDTTAPDATSGSGAPLAAVATVRIRGLTTNATDTYSGLLADDLHLAGTVLAWSQRAADPESPQIGPAWTLDPTALAWGTSPHSEIVYEFAAYPHADFEPGERTYLDLGTSPAEALAFATYRAHNPAQAWQPSGSEAAWSGNDASPAWGSPGIFRAFPADLRLGAQRYDFRVHVGQTPAAEPQSRITFVRHISDVADLVEVLSSVIIEPAGSRLPLAKRFRGITAVRFAVKQAAGFDAVRLRQIDLDPVGPLFGDGVDAAGAPARALADFTVQGY